MSEKKYSVEINGCDYLEDQLTGECYWSDWHEVVETKSFATKGEARRFVRSITTEQIIAYEKEACTNALGIDVLELIDTHGRFECWTLIGCVDWVGNNKVYENLED